jgi:hypothetical protein
LDRRSLKECFFIFTIFEKLMGFYVQEKLELFLFPLSSFLFPLSSFYCVVVPSISWTSWVSDSAMMRGRRILSPFNTLIASLSW